MAEYYLVGNLDDDHDLWLISKADRSAFPVPREIWEDVISMFPAAGLSADEADQEPRKDHAASIIAAAEGKATVVKSVSIALSTDQLGSMLVTMRSAPIEKAVSSDDDLSGVLKRYVSLNTGG